MNGVTLNIIHPIYIGSQIAKCWQYASKLDQDNAADFITFSLSLTANNLPT